MKDGIGSEGTLVGSGPPRYELGPGVLEASVAGSAAAACRELMSFG